MVSLEKLKELKQEKVAQVRSERLARFESLYDLLLSKFEQDLLHREMTYDSEYAAFCRTKGLDVEEISGTPFTARIEL